MTDVVFTVINLAPLWAPVILAVLGLAVSEMNA